MAGNNRDDDYSSDDDLMNFIPERLTEDGDPPPQGGGKGKSLLVAGALIGAAVAGAAGFYALSGGSGDGRVTAPVIPADDAPYKVRPADPGGMQVPNQDKLVYDRLEPEGETRPEVETLLPEPEAPATPPVAQQQAASPDQMETEGRESLPKASSDAPMSPPPPPSLEGEAAEGEGVQVPEAIRTMSGAGQTADTAASEAPETAPEGPAEQQPAESEASTAPDAPEEPVVKDTAPEPAAEQEPTAPAEAGKSQGAYMIQLAALRSEDAARKHFQTMQGKYPDLLGPLSLVVERADLGDKGVFYRVRATGLESEAAAKDVCKRLSQDKVGCLFVGKK